MFKIVWTNEMVTYLRENYADKTAAQIAVDIYRLAGVLVTERQVRTKINSLQLGVTQRKNIRGFRMSDKDVPYSYNQITIGGTTVYVVALLTEPYFMEAGDTLKKASQSLRRRYEKWVRSKWRKRPQSNRK